MEFDSVAVARTGAETPMPPDVPVMFALLVMYPLGFVALYGVKPNAVVTLPDVSDNVPPRVSEPLVVTEPVRVNPLTVPVPETLVTVPVLLVYPFGFVALYGVYPRPVVI
jgi:hypothetical protein